MRPILIYAVRFAIALLIFAVTALTPAAASATSTDQAVAYQLDPAHDGFQTGDPITAPLSKVWSDAITGSISYPLIVNGVVYVTVMTSSGSTLEAIDQATGATLWNHGLGGSFGAPGPAYAGGQLFTVNGTGLMTAFNAATGAINWSTQLPGQLDFSSAPTAADGMVFTGGAESGGTVYGVSQATGTVIWTASVENGDDSSPAVDPGNVYVTYACNQDYDFNPITGALIWHLDTACEGGGGDNPVLANGLLLSRDFDLGDVILSADAGTTEGAFSSGPAPAVDGATAYMVSGGQMTAVKQSGLGTNAWTFAGDSMLDTSPLVVGNLVFEGSSSGNVYAVDAQTGASTWSANSGSSIAGESGFGATISGLAAGEGTLIVPTSTSLVAYAGANVGSGLPTDTSAPTLSTTKAIVGDPLAVDVGLWTGLPSSYSYQWSRCPVAGGTCSAITDATSEAYTPTRDDIGSTLEVTIKATNSSGTSSALTTGTTEKVAALPANVSPPTITGKALPKRLLTATPGIWANNPTAFKYQWLRCQGSSCAPEPHAFMSSYVVTPADIGSTIEVRVTATNGVGSPAPATSSPTATVTKVPTGLTLSSSPGSIVAGQPVTLTATVTPRVDGGVVAFIDGGSTLPGCSAVPVARPTSSASCAVASAPSGSAFAAGYSGDESYAASSGDLSAATTAAVAVRTRALKRARPRAERRHVHRRRPAARHRIRFRRRRSR
jgi:outer membrane protein assembly factor BamB